MNHTVSNAERERQRRFPFTYGGHTVAEFARLLLVEGRSYHDIARLWDMLPRAGPRDLKTDLYFVWRRHDYWGGRPEPQGHGRDYAAEWEAWRAQRDAALTRWLQAAAMRPIDPHCETCTCYGAAR